MKNVKLPILGLSLVLLVASCKKDDFKEESDTTTSAAVNSADSLSWQSATQWEKADQGTFSVHYFTIADSSITADVADNGLVLVYKKAGNSINSLPFEETKNSKEAGSNASTPANANYWYHQVAEGNLLISYDVYNTPANSDDVNKFQYFVITPETLETLQTNGYTPEKLMGLSYAEAANLLKTVN